MVSFWAGGISSFLPLCPRISPATQANAHADGNTGQRWKKWLGRFERLLIAMNIEEKKQQRRI